MPLWEKHKGPEAGKPLARRCRTGREAEPSPLALLHVQCNLPRTSSTSREGS